MQHVCGTSLHLRLARGGAPSYGWLQLTRCAAPGLELCLGLRLGGALARQACQSQCQHLDPAGNVLHSSSQLNKGGAHGGQVATQPATFCALCRHRADRLGGQGAADVKLDGHTCGEANSSGRWLQPLRQGMKIMPVGAICGTGGPKAWEDNTPGGFLASLCIALQLHAASSRACATKLG